MSTGKTIAQDSVGKQAQGLRKLKLLLQRWWQKHNQKNEHGRESFLTCALLYGGTYYLSQLTSFRGQQSAPETSFISALAIIEKLWPKSLCGAASDYFARVQNQSSSLLSDKALQKDFLTLVSHPLVQELFTSPLCPSAIYEAFSFSERRISKDLLQDDRLELTGSHLVSFTQVYTPAWIVDHLLQSTLSPALEKCSDIKELSKLTLLDPALGGGIFLVQALEPLMAAYKTRGLSAPAAAKYAFAQNMFGLDIDPAALSTAALSLILKAASLGLSAEEIEAILPLSNLQLIVDEEGDQFPLGSLSKDLRAAEGHILSRQYNAVVANPPYLGRKLLPRPLKEKLKRHYPDSASDLSQAFLSMALDLTKPGGRVGFITQGSMLHLASAKSLREKILNCHQLLQVVELGAGVFPFLAGEKASTALVIIQNEKPAADQEGSFLSLVKGGDKPRRLASSLPASGQALLAKMEQIGTVRRQSDFLADEDGAINYMRPPVVSNLKSSLAKLGDLATLKQGLATTNNAKFLRYIWEIDAADIGKRYVPYVRGEGGERWWSPPITMVLWENNGAAIKSAVCKAYPYLKGNYAWVVKNEDYYFRSGLTFSFVSKDRLAVRNLPPGAIFDVGSSAIFIDDDREQGAMLAYLNSSLATAMAHDLNPTINFQVGDLKKLVVPKFTSEEKTSLSNLTAACTAAKERLFMHSSAQRFFLPVNGFPCMSSKSISVRQEDFDLTEADYDLACSQLGACEKEIDNLVMNSIARGSNLDENEIRAIRDFTDRPVPAKNNKLTGKVFCQTNLIEGLLAYFQKANEIRSGREDQVVVLLAALKDESEAEALVDLLPGQFDRSYLRSHLDHGKGLAHYFREELARALEDEFMGQPPLLAIKIEPQVVLIVPTKALHTACIMIESGTLTASARNAARDVLGKLGTIPEGSEIRAKDLGKLFIQDHGGTPKGPSLVHI